MKKTESIVITVIFCLLLIIPLAATLLSPKRTFSEWENRALAKAPTPSAETVFSGEFGRDFESWLTDHFFARDFLVKLKRSADNALFIKESNGVIVGKTALFDLSSEISEKAVDKNVSAINLFAKNNSIETSLMLVPSSASVFPDALPVAAPTPTDTDAIRDIYSRLDAVTALDALTPLSEMTLEEAFFKTDHHWTSRGAARVYSSWKGGEFEFETVSDSFFGTLTSRSGDTTVDADKLEKILSGDKFTSCLIYNGVSTAEYDSMYFDSYLDKKDKYSYFLGTNEPLVTLEREGEGKTLLIFKDSFAHSFVQCCAEDYARVILVDLRYVTSPISYLVDLETVDEVLFLYSVENFTTQDNMMWIK